MNIYIHLPLYQGSEKFQTTGEKFKSTNKYIGLKYTQGQEIYKSIQPSLVLVTQCLQREKYLTPIKNNGENSGENSQSSDTIGNRKRLIFAHSAFKTEPNIHYIRTPRYVTRIVLI